MKLNVVAKEAQQCEDMMQICTFIKEAEKNNCNTCYVHLPDELDLIPRH
jgi:hypothetical protein